MSFEIDKGIQIIDKRRTAGECPFPFAEMDVGDSFHVTALTPNEFTNKRASVQNWVRKFRKSSGIRFFSISTRSTDTGFRVWRMS